MKRPVAIIGLIVIVLLVAVFLRFESNRSQRQTHHKMVGITVSAVSLRAAPLFLKTQGTIEASQSVTIQPQVSGVIKKINFTPGQNVEAGQLLFVIDPATYQAQLAKDQATLAKDQAQLAATAKDVKRYEPLIKRGYVSKQLYDQTKAQLAEQQNLVKSDQALIRQDQVQLSYTQIRAPIAGKTGNVTVKKGDLVNAQSTTPLVTVNQLDPIFVNFNLPQSDLTQLLQYQQQKPLTVEVYAENDKKLLDTGKLTFIDNNVNANTGTILLKGTLPNKKNLLWPGEAVSVKLIFTVQENVVTIPSQAVQTDEQGPFVYLIKNGRAYITRIKVLRQLGRWTFVSSGLNKGDIVATIFPPDLNDQSLIKIIPTTEKTKNS